MRSILLLISSCLISTASLSLSAKVISQSNNGFEIRIESTVKQSAADSYLQFLAVGEWWNSDHTWFGDAAKLYIDPFVQGCFCEKDGNKSAIHMIVSYIEPNKEVRMIGGLGPLQMMGVSGGMSWKFEAINDNETKIIQHYQVSGYMDGGMQQLAAIVNKVQSIQQQGLVKKLSSNKP